ncbi:BQ5605_C023g09756 [Microbotryum silenes-dioicae]|uniref:BQ5605_C023g09756 protein n=1 Tax=Microbotryum silenes-dioicae TaxID=796604 RepID=A0A2X0MLI9_9BASI|nr:BQ5605_C023g09756 [Microbotryum silenes-dioicae]
MSLARSCGHLARLTGVRSTTSTAPSYFTRPTASHRSIHAFTPTAPRSFSLASRTIPRDVTGSADPFQRCSTVLKKKAGKKNAASAVSDAFDALEFEEDLIDDIDSEPTTTSTSNNGKSTSDYPSLHAYLSKRLELPHFAFKSNIPSVSAVKGLLHLTARDDRSRTLQLLKLWRQRNLPYPNSETSSEFVRSWTRMNEIEEMVQVLARRDLYGLGLVQPGDFVNALQKLTTVEGEVADAKTLMPKLETAKTIQELLRLEGVNDLTAVVSTLAMALRLNESKAVRRLPALIDDLLAEVREMDSEDAVKSLKGVPGVERQAWVVKKVQECQNRVAEPKDRALLGRILDKVQQ